MFKDYYKTLGLTLTSSEEEIKQAYRELAFKYHPDTNPDEDAHQMFVEIKEAYEVLADPHARTRYNIRYTSYQAPSQPSQNNPTYMRYEQVRARRSNRYGRSQYSRRFTYRGSYSTAESRASAAAEAGVPPDQMEEEAPTFVRYKYKQALDRESDRKGYKWFARVAFVVCGVAFLYCLFLVTDRFLSRNVPVETVKIKKQMAWTLMQPGFIQISTDNYRFQLSRTDGGRFLVGDEINMRATPLRRVVTHVYINRSGKTYKVATVGGTSAMANLLIFALLIGIPFMYKYRYNHEVISYLGTVFMLLFVMLLGMMSR